MTECVFSWTVRLTASGGGAGLEAYRQTDGLTLLVLVSLWDLLTVKTLNTQVGDESRFIDPHRSEQCLVMSSGNESTYLEKQLNIKIIKYPLTNTDIRT